MKKGLIVAVAAVAVVGIGAGGYLTYQKQAEQKAYEDDCHYFQPANNHNV